MDERLTLAQVPGLEESYKDWMEETEVGKSTRNAYWTRISDFPFFTLQEDSVDEIIGLIDSQVSSQPELTAIRNFLEFLYEDYEGGDLSGEEKTQMKRKKNSVRSNISLPKTAKTNSKANRVQKINRNFIHSDDLVEILRMAEPERAKMWYLLYESGMRIGELKRLTPKHLREDYGEFGAIKIDAERSKSALPRTIKFLSDYPYLIFKDAPTGTWSDEVDDTWSNVFYPGHYAQQERYYLKKYCEEIGVGSRSPHSLRHTRITHLVQLPKDSYLSDKIQGKDDVQRRAGHSNPQTTDLYTETTFDREPLPLEDYIRQENIDLMEVLEK